MAKHKAKKVKTQKILTVEPEEPHHDQATHQEIHEDPSQAKVHLEFYGSEVLRQKAPDAFELAQAVAQEWVSDGNFQKLPISSPLAQLVASIGLQSAKRVEKKLEEKGVISMAKMGFELAKAKWNKK